MVHVLEVGKGAKKTTCRNCESTLQYKPSESTKKHHTDYSGSGEYYNVIVCPACGVDVEVPF